MVTAIYLSGSAAFADYDLARSDLDVIFIVQRPLSDSMKMELLHQLSHEMLPCPAEGVDLIVFLETAVTSPSRIPLYEFSLASGANWKIDVSYGGDYAGPVIDLGICRERGQSLLGPPPKEKIGSIPRNWIEEELHSTVEWHQGQVHDSFHDPWGYNAVLNACRAWKYHERGEFTSKSEGGRWAMSRAPQYEVIGEAVEARRNKWHKALKREKVMAFLDFVQEQIAV